MQNPIQTIWGFQIFKVFFEKLIFFTVPTPILHNWEEWSQQKITICSLTVQKPFQTILGIQFFFQNLEKFLNFSQYFLLDKCVEYVEIMWDLGQI